MENKKSSFHRRRTLRKLVLCSKEYLQYLNNFEQWLRVFGFAQSTIYYSPAYLRSFFFFLEQEKIFQISSISNYHLVRYMQFLNERTIIRTRIKLSSNYRLNHLNAVKLFARYLRESQTGNIDASYRFSRDTSEVRNCLPNKEIASLYNACDSGNSSNLDRVILGLYYGLGLRRMEGIGLDTQDLNIDSGLMQVRNAKFKQVRMVPVSRRIMEDIQKYRKRYRDPLLKKLGKTKENALLISKCGNRLSGK